MPRFPYEHTDGGECGAHKKWRAPKGAPQRGETAASTTRNFTRRAHGRFPPSSRKILLSAQKNFRESYLYTLPRIRVLEHHPVPLAVQVEHRKGHKRAEPAQGFGRFGKALGGHAVAYVLRAPLVADDAHGVMLAARKGDLRPARVGDAGGELLFGRVLLEQRPQIALHLGVVAGRLLGGRLFLFGRSPFRSLFVFAAFACAALCILGEGRAVPALAALDGFCVCGRLFRIRPPCGRADAEGREVCVGKGIIDSSLTHHLQFAKSNGVTREEISAMLTHIAFYAGWPNAWGAFRLAKDVWAEDQADDNGKAAFQREMIFPIGEPNTAFAKYFIGNSYLARISEEQVPFSNVTFEPRCRNNWHIHHASEGGGQMLVCVAGKGWYKEEGKPAVQMLPGDVIHIPANVKHWHGAAADSWFAHLAFEVPGKDTSNEWLEPVSDEEYDKLGK